MTQDLFERAGRAMWRVKRHHDPETPALDSTEDPEFYLARSIDELKGALKVLQDHFSRTGDATTASVLAILLED